jgi:hypothetical protein
VGSGAGGQGSGVEPALLIRVSTYLQVNMAELVRDLTSLQTLDLSFRANENICRSGIKNLATELVESSCLRRLSLNLAGTQTGNYGAIALSDLKRTTTLYSLNLNLSYQKQGHQVNMFGATGLAGMATSNSLCHINLNLARVKRVGKKGRHIGGNTRVNTRASLRVERVCK